MRDVYFVCIYTAIMCPPPEVSHGCHYNPNFVAWHIGQKVTFYCPAGHKLVGHAYATCSTGGKWDNAPPRCDARKYIVVHHRSSKLIRDLCCSQSMHLTKTFRICATIIRIPKILESRTKNHIFMPTRIRSKRQ